MAILTWDQTGQRFYETGVDKGVLYIPNGSGVYNNGVAWNGLTNVSESPSGAEANAQYADNIKYLNLVSAEEFNATLEAFTYPDAFAQYDGLAAPATGMTIGQQSRKTFGLSYRTRLGNDLLGDDYGYKLHLVYGCQASPSEKAYNTINDSPEAISFSWEISTTPVAVAGYKPTSIVTIDSTKVTAPDLAAIELLLYGDVAVDPAMPTVETIIGILTNAQTSVMPLTPTFVAGTGVITIPVVTGVVYRRADTGVVASGTVTIGTPGATLVITAEPLNNTYVFAAGADDDFSFTRS
jgi:hypothetical protein